METLSYLNDQQLKTDLVQEVKRHQELDIIIQGDYGKENGHWKGCKVGCSIHSLNLIRGKNYGYDDHSVYPKEFGVPQIIATLTDRIFEGLPLDNAKTFPMRFWEAVPVGKDLNSVWRKFLIWLLVDPTEGVIKYAKAPERKKVIQDVADLLEKSLTQKIKSKEFQEVRRAARAYAAYAAADVADADAAYAAYAAYAAADVADAAYVAAYADAAYAAAAYAAAYAADADAAYAAADAADADAAYAAYAADADAARKRKFIVMADKLIELLKAA